MQDFIQLFLKPISDFFQFFIRLFSRVRPVGAGETPEEAKQDQKSKDDKSKEAEKGKSEEEESKEEDILATYYQSTIKVATTSTTFVYLPGPRTMSVILDMEQGSYVSEEKNVYNLFGELIYGFLLFVFFFIILALPLYKSQCYVRALVTEPSDSLPEARWTSLLAGFVVTKSPSDFNEILLAIISFLSTYTDISLNKLAINFTNVPKEFYDSLAFYYKGYVPEIPLIKTYVEQLQQLEE